MASAGFFPAGFFRRLRAHLKGPWIPSKQGSEGGLPAWLCPTLCFRSQGLLIAFDAVWLAAWLAAGLRPEANNQPGA